MADLLKGNAVVGQSGGPTAVINCSLAGVVDEAAKHDAISNVYGARNGILGVLNEELYDFEKQSREDIRGLLHTPSAAIGSCRYKLKPEDYDRVLDVFKAHDVRYFFYAGGNDSQDTLHRVATIAAEGGWEMRCIGIPKTIDNDLGETDHCPGYGSVGRYIAIATMDCGRDNESIYTSDTVKVIETMGRNTGWITATAGLGKKDEEDPPHIMLFPEIPFEEERFLAKVEQFLDKMDRCVISVCEGVKRADGEYIVADKSSIATDGFGHAQLSGVGDWICRLIMHELNVKARFNKPGTCQRSSVVCASKVDQEEAYLVGKRAVEHAVGGETDKMVTLVRESDDPYRCTTGLVEAEKVALAEHKMPREYIDEEGFHITDAFRRYAMPLLGDPLPHYVRLKKIFVPKKVT